MVGLALFTLASLASGFAPSLPALIAGRVLQGAGAALLVPCALSLIRRAYPDDAARAKAIATWATCGGVAQVLGPLVGGLLLAASDWRAIFFVNLPICLVGLWLTLKVGGGADDHGSRRLDVPGQLSVALAMVLLVVALIEGRELGWGNAWIVAAAALSVLCAASFVLIERRSASPMLPLSLFSSPVLSWISVTMLLGSAAFFGMLFVLNLYFLKGAGYTPLQTGMAMLPLALLATAGNVASARLAHVASPLGLMLAGSTLRLFAFAGLAWASTGFPYPLVALPLALIGFGSGLSNPMAISLMVSAADEKYSGAASGVSTTIGQLGASIGVAVFGAFLLDAQGIAEGTRTAAAICAALTAVNVIIVWRLRRRRDRRRPEG
jgi:DHA2 family methylenomycin A resistance protein-like MFS transporter